MKASYESVPCTEHHLSKLFYFKLGFLAALVLSLVMVLVRLQRATNRYIKIAERK